MSNKRPIIDNLLILTVTFNLNNNLFDQIYSVKSKLTNLFLVAINFGEGYSCA